MKKDVVIIGGGIAGMEAARQLLSLGYRPVIIEKEAALGGHVAQWHQLFPDMSSAQELIDSMKQAVAPAEVHLTAQLKSMVREGNLYRLLLEDGSSMETEAVLLASGFQLFDATRKEEYGYGVYDHVITNADLEHWLNTREDARVPQQPQAIGFVHCVGSRDLKSGNSQCSKVCCMTAVKQAIEMKTLYPSAEVYCFYMDLRLFGKKYEDFYIQAQQECDVHFIRGRVSEVGETIDGRLQVKAEDTLVGKPLKVQLDLLVLMSGMLCNPQAARLLQPSALETDSDGFLKSRDNLYALQYSGQEGLFYAGACTGTKTVPETLMEARAAALSIHQYLQEK